ncbi:MAG: flippase-like domain-containing protein [Candidatus Aminicenantes bacterium]|nr:flippase-like domain-containing protein [Candidatus Aminicenantes bacterium]
MTEKKSKKKILFLLLRVVVSAGLIGYFLSTLAVDEGSLTEALRKFVRAFSSASIEWLVPAFLLHIVGFSLISLRWKILLKAQGVNAAYIQLLQYYFMGAFFNTFLPSTIGGDTVRVVESRRLTGQTSTSIMVVIIERLTGMIALGLIAAAALFLKLAQQGSQEKVTWFFVTAILGGFFLLVWLAHPKIAPHILNLSRKILPVKIQSFLEQSYQAAAMYYKHPRALFSALGVSLLFQLSIVTYYYFISKSLNQDPDPLDFLLKAPILVFLLMTVPSVNGIGVRTSGFSQLMKFPKAVALSAEIIDLGIKYIYALCGGLVFLLKRRTPSNPGEGDNPNPETRKRAGTRN